MSDKLCILVVSDQEYWVYLLTLLASIKIHLTPNNYCVHAHLINCTEDYNLILPTIFKNTTISAETINLPNNDEKVGYCINIRIPLIKQMLAKHKYVLFLDADTLIRGNLDEMFNDIKNYDFVCYDHIAQDFKRHNYKHNIKCGVMGFRQSENMNRFIDDWLKADTLLGFRKIHSDQDSLNDLISNKYDNVFSIKCMDEKFFDFEWLKKESIIWPGKGHRKKVPIFVNYMIKVSRNDPYLRQQVDAFNNALEEEKYMIKKQKLQKKKQENEKKLKEDRERLKNLRAEAALAQKTKVAEAPQPPVIVKAEEPSPVIVKAEEPTPVIVTKVEEPKLDEDSRKNRQLGFLEKRRKERASIRLKMKAHRLEALQQRKAQRKLQHKLAEDKQLNNNE